MLGRVSFLFDQKERCREIEVRCSIGTALAVCPMRSVANSLTSFAPLSTMAPAFLARNPL